jgi:hypothetical protein
MRKKAGGASGSRIGFSPQRRRMPGKKINGTGNPVPRRFVLPAPPLGLSVHDADLVISVANGHFHRFREDVRVTVRNPLERVLSLVQFDDEYGWVGFFQNAAALDRFSPSAVGFQHDLAAYMGVKTTFDFG